MFQPTLYPRVGPAKLAIGTRVSPETTAALIGKHAVHIWVSGMDLVALLDPFLCTPIALLLPRAWRGGGAGAGGGAGGRVEEGSRVHP